MLHALIAVNPQYRQMCDNIAINNAILADLRLTMPEPSGIISLTLAA
jgi:hypothetical protein